jgi:hypothetical protein
MVSASQTKMTRFIGQTRALFVLAGVVIMAGCAPKPWMQSAYPEPVDGTTVIETDERAVHIIVQSTDPSAPPPDVIVEQRTTTPSTNDGWIPTAFPAPNPFEKHGTWVGDYDCTQGNTGFALRIMDVRGRVVRAIFDFMHAPSGAKGSYIVTGSFDPDTRRVRFEPSSWIEQPDHYLMVPMKGEISTDGSLFAGKIDYPGCGAFHLKPTR